MKNSNWNLLFNTSFLLLLLQLNIEEEKVFFFFLCYIILKSITNELSTTKISKLVLYQQKKNETLPNGICKEKYIKLYVNK